MSNILFFYVGNSYNENKFDLFKSQHNIYSFFDKQNCSSPISSDKLGFTVEYSNPDGLNQLISEISSIDQIFIFSKLTNYKEKLEEMQEILDKVFLILKAVTFKLMLQKRGNVWLVHEQYLDIRFLSSELGAGLKSLIQVFAMEMSKKGIKANYILLNSNEEKAKVKLEDIIKWSESDCVFNFTAQQLII